MIDAMKCSEIIKAFAEGKDVGYFTSNNVWSHFNSIEGLIGYLYAEDKIPTIKPKPKLVPWTMADVPFDCWIRSKFNISHVNKIIKITTTHLNCLANNDFTQNMLSSCVIRTLSFDELLEDWECSSDLKTWHPCGKYVNN